MITGSIGMLSSASLNETKFGACMNQATVPHRILPEKILANPIATILSAAMMLRYSFDLDKEAEAVEMAVQKVLEDGYRTADIAAETGMEHAADKKQPDTKKLLLHRWAIYRFLY